MKPDGNEIAKPGNGNLTAASSHLDEVGSILAAAIQQIEPGTPDRDATLALPAFRQTDHRRKGSRSESSVAPPTVHLDQKALAQRWTISPRTLERWRWLGAGPRYLKLGGRVLYRLQDIEAYEAQQLRG